jgi:hypothetical protein
MENRTLNPQKKSNRRPVAEVGLTNLRVAEDFWVSSSCVDNTTVTGIGGSDVTKVGSKWGVMITHHTHLMDLLIIFLDLKSEPFLK